MADIIFDQQNRLGFITLNRPDKLNALTHEMCVEMRDQLAEWAVDDSIQAIFLRGAGEKAFCAGGDVRAASEVGLTDPIKAREFFRCEYRNNAIFKRFPKPLISILNGIVMGGGAGISIHGSHRIITENTRFAMPESRIGFFPDVGMAAPLAEIPNFVGIYLALTAAEIGAADMLYTSLGTHYIPREKLEAFTTALVKAENLSRGIVDTLIKDFCTDPGEPPMANHIAQIDKCFSGINVASILRNLELEGSDWAKQQAETIGKMSPTSLAVALKHLREAPEYTFEDLLRRDFWLACRFLEAHDFHEGIRAYLIDKDQKPRWNPQHTSELSNPEIEFFFTPLSQDELEFD